jgi:hypothetical protein
MELSEMLGEVSKLRAQISLLEGEIARIEMRYSKEASRKFIVDNNIKKSMIQTSKIEGLWFNQVDNFGYWLKKTNCTKPYAEWNGRIYPTEEIKAGGLPHWTKAPGHFEDSPD